MGFELSAAWLGVVADSPGTTLQPELQKGIHLRWASSASRGFPWFGYFVFARKPKAPKRVCASDGWSRRDTGPIETLSLDSPVGLWTSDRRIAITRDFTVKGELDLADRRGLTCKLHPALTARSIHVTVCFRNVAPPAGRPGIAELFDGVREAPWYCEPVTRDDSEVPSRAVGSSDRGKTLIRFHCGAVAGTASESAGCLVSPRFDGMRGTYPFTGWTASLPSARASCDRVAPHEWQS